MYRSANDDQNDGQKQKMRDGFKKDDVGSVAAKQQTEYQRSRHGDGQDDGLSHGDSLVAALVEPNVKHQENAAQQEERQRYLHVVAPLKMEIAPEKQLGLRSERQRWRRRR